MRHVPDARAVVELTFANEDGPDQKTRAAEVLGALHGFVPCLAPSHHVWVDLDLGVDVEPTLAVDAVIFVLNVYAFGAQYMLAVAKSMVEKTDDSLVVPE